MQERTYTKEEIEAARTSARHTADGFIVAWRASEGPKAVRLAEQVKDVYEADLRRLLRGAPTLQEHIHAHLNPRSRRFTGMRQKAGVPERGKLQDLHCVRRF